MTLFVIFQSHSSVSFWKMLSFFSHNMEERMEHIRLVLQRVKKKIIHESRKKMWVSSVSFQGFIIEQGQVKSDPAKVQDYSRIAALLRQPTPTSTFFSWTPEAKSAFCMFTLLAICACPPPPRSFLSVYCGGRYIWISSGTCLSQQGTGDQKWHLWVRHSPWLCGRAQLRHRESPTVGKAVTTRWAWWFVFGYLTFTLTYCAGSSDIN